MLPNRRLEGYEKVFIRSEVERLLEELEDLDTSNRRPMRADRRRGDLPLLNRFLLYNFR